VPCFVSGATLLSRIVSADWAIGVPLNPGRKLLSWDDTRARKLDLVLCWKLDRFGRSMLDCLANLRELDSHGVRFIATTQALDTDNRNPATKFLLHVLGAAARV
jgi:hypothetical protein